MLGAFQRNLGERLTGPDGAVQFVTVAKDGSETKWEVQSRLAQKFQTPYWIIKVPREIMRDHGDIFNENALAMMARLFRVSNPSPQAGVATSAAPRTMRLMAPGENTPPPAPPKRKP